MPLCGTLHASVKKEASEKHVKKEDGEKHVKRPRASPERKNKDKDKKASSTN